MMNEQLTKAEIREMILTTHQFRYATKKFDETKKISDEDWAIIEEVARLSPSSFGYEPWKFLIIHNEQIKTDLRPFAWGALNSLDGASHFVIALARKNVKANSTHVKHIVEAVQGRDFSQVSRQQEFFKQFQEHDFNLTTEKDIFQWATKQTYIALGNMLTAAAELGIDSCPIEGFNIAQTEDYLSSQGLINLSDYGVAYMAGFGYSAEERPLKKRQNKHEIFEVIN